MSAKLNVNHLYYSYHTMEGETPALSDITFEIESGEFIAVVGPSGCGKSTLLSLLSGLLKPDNGEILMSGMPIDPYQNPAGYMLQKDHLLEWRNILSNAGLGLEIRHQLTPDTKKHLIKMLEDYGLGQFIAAKPSQLSGGMRQRAALVRTLALEPDLLLLDEPFSALDYQTRLQVCNDISSIIRKQEKTAILITHDLAEAVSVADRVIILTRRPGRIKAILPIPFEKPDATPLERRNSPEFQQYFQQVWAILQD